MKRIIVAALFCSCALAQAQTDDKDALIQSLKDRVAAQEQQIKALQAQVASLKAKLSATSCPAEAASTGGATSKPASRPAAHKPKVTVAKAMSQVIPVANLQDMPFKDAIAWLSETCGLNIKVDWTSMQVVGVERTKKVTVKASKAKVEKVLALLLENAGGGTAQLGFEVDGDVVNISTVEVLDSHTVTQTYNVARLLPNRGPGAMDQLIQTIRTTVMPDSWKPEGTVGTITEQNGQLVITQSLRAHAAIAELLKKLRK
jgi:uncharacterized coiled-coil protein SlyX